MDMTKGLRNTKKAERLVRLAMTIHKRGKTIKYFKEVIAKLII